MFQKPKAFFVDIIHCYLIAWITLFSFVGLSSSAYATQECGKASWYALTSRTASGEMMDPNAMTAAHRTLPFGTKVRVTNLRNGKTVTVRINDRGPFIKGRIIDLSKAAARKLGFLRAGWTPVRVSPATRNHSNNMHSKTC